MGSPRDAPPRGRGASASRVLGLQEGRGRRTHPPLTPSAVPRPVVGAGPDRRAPLYKWGSRVKGASMTRPRLHNRIQEVSIGGKAGFLSPRTGPGGCQSWAVRLGKFSASQVPGCRLLSPSRALRSLGPKEGRGPVQSLSFCRYVDHKTVRGAGDQSLEEGIG